MLFKVSCASDRYDSKLVVEEATEGMLDVSTLEELLTLVHKYGDLILVKTKDEVSILVYNDLIE